LTFNRLHGVISQKIELFKLFKVKDLVGYWKTLVQLQSLYSVECYYQRTRQKPRTHYKKTPPYPSQSFQYNPHRE
jgi:hypothetical protein